MTNLGELYNAIAARMALVPGVMVRQRVPIMEIARSRPSQPLAVLNWLGIEGEDPRVVGSGAQELIVRWEINILAPGNPAARVLAEDEAHNTAMIILDQIAPVDHSWRPAADCGYIELETMEALGDSQAGYVIAMVVSHRQWRS